MQKMNQISDWFNANLSFSVVAYGPQVSMTMGDNASAEGIILCKMRFLILTSREDVAGMMKGKGRFSNAKGSPNNPSMGTTWRMKGMDERASGVLMAK